MDSRGQWQAKLKRQIQDALTELHQEQEWWERTTINGPFNLMDWHARARKKIRGRWRPGKFPNIDRDIAAGHKRIWDDYFRVNPVYTDAHGIE